MDRYYDDGFGGFSRRIPAATNRLGSFMSDSHAEAWFPRPERRELQFSEGEPNPVVHRVGSKHTRSPPPKREDSRPEERHKVRNLLESLPKHSRLKSLLKGPIAGPPPEDESDESNDDERSVASAFRHVVKKEPRRKRSESLSALRDHSAKGIKGQQTLGAAVRRQNNAFKVNKEETAKDMVKESLRSLNRHAKRSASAHKIRKAVAKISGAVATGVRTAANGVANGVGLVANAVGSAGSMVANGVGHVAQGVKHVVGAVGHAVGHYIAPDPAPALSAPRGRSRTARTGKAPVVAATAVPVPAPATVQVPVLPPVIPVIHPAEAAHRARATALGIDHSNMVFTKYGEPHRSRTANNVYWASIAPAPSPAATPMGLRSRRRAVS
jgi:hypothetical protein